MLPLLAKILDDGVKGVVAVGVLDFVTTYTQSEACVAGIAWKYQNEYNAVKRVACEYGMCKEYQNLREYRVDGSGHQISVYKPEFALEIIEKLIDWKP